MSRSPLRTRSTRRSACTMLALSPLALAGVAMSMLDATPEAEAAQTGARAEKLLVYVGTYSQRGSAGIYVYQLDLASGQLTPVGTGPETKNPSFVAVHPSHRYLYAVNEIGDFQGTKSGAVSAFAIDPKTGSLTFLNQQSSGGDGPCYLVTDKTGKNVLVANYGGGTVSALPIQADGRLAAPSCTIQHQGSGVDKRRQERPHAHSINLDAANRFAIAADLGLDQLLVYRFDGAKGTLTPNEPPFATVAPGSGPRHFAWHPSGKYGYAINEMASTVTAFEYDARGGRLTSFQTLSTLPADFKGGTSCAEVQVTPDGRFLYGSNRGHHSLAIFAIDGKTGRLTPVGHQSTLGKTPRGFGIDPTGRFVLVGNQETDNLVVFRIDRETGKLTSTGQEIKVPVPVCVKFMPAPTGR